MADISVEDLGPFGFQNLVAALLVKSFGVGLSPMGPGSDGGRDVYTHDPISWGAGATAQGYTVFQIKGRSESTARADVSWLWGEIRKELVTWTESDTRMKMPDTLVFVSNCYRTAKPDSGGHDQIERSIDTFREALREAAVAKNASQSARLKHERMSAIAEVRVLDGYWLEAALRDADAVRQAFPALMTGPDVLRMMLSHTGAVGLPDVVEVLRVHARQQLQLDGEVWMAETGERTTDKVELHQIAVDVPLLPNDFEATSIVQAALDLAEQMLRPRLNPVVRRRHLVIAGAAGNGKTTTSKLIVQAFRAALLKEQEYLSTGHKAIIDGTEAVLNRLGRQLPRHHRWPLRIDLKDLVHSRLLDEGGSMMRAISNKLAVELDAGTISPAVLSSWYRQWPWLIMFDGLDELTDLNARSLAISRIRQFAEEAEADDADVFIVVTTRPYGYEDELSPELFRRVDLAGLEVDDALAYAERIADARLHHDAPRKAQLLRRITAAAANPSQRPLLRTPLLIMVLSIIADSGEELAPDRFGLFATYYDLAYAREARKGGRMASMLDRLRPVIEALHARVGFELHERSESEQMPDPVITGEELRDLIRDELQREGFKPNSSDSSLIDEAYNTAMHRLVLITPQREGFGFEIRSLRELSAAYWINSGPEDIVMARVRAAAASPHWRNTVLLATGAMFRRGTPDRHLALTELLGRLDEGAPFGRAFPVGPRLALEMIDDGMVRNRPARRAELFAVALRLIAKPLDADGAGVISMLIRVVLEHEDTELGPFLEALRGASVSSSVARHNAVTVRALTSSPSWTSPKVQGLIARSISDDAVPARTDWSMFQEEVDTAPLPAEAADRLVAAARELSRWRDDDFDVDVVLSAVHDPDAAMVLDSALVHVIETIGFAQVLRAKVWARWVRTPIASRIRDAGTDASAGAQDL